MEIVRLAVRSPPPDRPAPAEIVIASSAFSPRSVTRSATWDCAMAMLVGVTPDTRPSRVVVSTGTLEALP